MVKLEDRKKLSTGDWLALLPLSVIGLAVPLIVTPGLVEPYSYMKESIFEMLLALSLLGYTFNLPKKTGLNFSIHYLQLLLVASFLICCISVLGSETRFYGARRLVEIGELLTFAFLISHLWRHRLARSLLIAGFMLGAIITSVYGILQWNDVIRVNWQALHWEAGLGRRIFSTIGNPNFLGEYILCLIWLPLALYLISRHPLLRLTAGAAWLLMYAALLYTNSWGCYLGALVGGIFFTILFIRSRYSTSATRDRIVVAIIAFLLTASFVRYKGSQVVGETTGAVARALLYQAAVDMIKERPLTGFGLDNYFAYSNKYISRLSTKPQYNEIFISNPNLILRNPGRVHNELLSLWVELGIIGAILGLYFSIITMRYIIREVKLTDSKSALDLICCAAGLAAVVAQSMVNFPLRTTVPSMACAFILAAAIARLNNGNIIIARGKAALSMALAIMLASATMAAFLCYRSISRIKSQVHYTKQERFATQGMIGEALAETVASNNAHVLSTESIFRQAKYSLMLKELDLAQQAISLCKRIQPFHEYTHFLDAQLRAAKGNHEAAIEGLRAAIELEPRYAAAYILLIERALKLKRIDLAAEYYDRALAYIKSSQDLINTGGILAAHQGDLEQARQRFKEADKMLNGNVVARYNLHVIDSFSPDVALGHLIGYIEYGWITDRLNEGLRSFSDGDLSRANSFYETILRRFPDYVPAVSNIGSVYLRQGDLNNAAIYFNKALSIDPKHQVTRENLRFLEAIATQKLK